jgi:hypothetical protein
MAMTPIILIILIPGTMGLTWFMQSATKTALVQFPASGPNADYKSKKPLIPFTLTKTAVLRGNTIVYNVTNSQGSITGGTDIITIIDKNGKRTNSSPSVSGNQFNFDVTGLKDVTVVNTYTLNKVTATAVTVIGDGPLEAIACPIVDMERTISLKSKEAKGHCAPGYAAPEVCADGSSPWPGNEMANDIVGQNMIGNPVILPALPGNDGKLQKIAWSNGRISTDAYTYNDQKQNFVEYRGKTVDGKEYLIQLHHLYNVDSTKTNSGDVIGYTAGFDGDVSSPHVHVQIAERNSKGQFEFVPAEKYLKNCETPPV